MRATQVAAALGRKLDFASLNATMPDHGSEAYASAEQNSKALEGAARLEQSEAVARADRSGPGKLHEQFAAAGNGCSRTQPHSGYSKVPPGFKQMCLLVMAL